MMKEEGTVAEASKAPHKPGEAIASFRPHWIVFARPTIMLVVFGGASSFALYKAHLLFPPHLWEALSLAFVVLYVAIIGASALAIVQAAVASGATKLEVFHDRVVYGGGVANRWTICEPMSEVTLVSLERPFAGIILGFGTVRVETRGVSRLIVPRFGRAVELADLVQRLSLESRMPG